MNKIQAKRLLNVAQILREANATSQKKLFTMEKFLYGEQSNIFRLRDDNSNPKYCNIEEEFCGTPACALGHYAARPDRQRLLKIVFLKRHDGVRYADLAFTNDARQFSDVGFADKRFSDHFGLNYHEMEKLFGWGGCGGGATTPLRAAKYIERFVKQKMYPGRSTR